MSNSVYIAGTGPASGKSVVVLGVIELLSRHGRRIGFFRPIVDKDAISDRLIGLVTSRYDITAPRESMFGATNTTARDLISRHKEDELQSLILEKARNLAHECDFVVCAGTDYRAMHTALEFEFNVDVARNLGAPLLPVVSGRGKTLREIAEKESKAMPVFDPGCGTVSRPCHKESAFPLLLKERSQMSGVEFQTLTPSPRPSPSREREFTDGRQLDCRQAPPQER